MGAGMCSAVAAAAAVRRLVQATREGVGLSRRGAFAAAAAVRAGSARGQQRQQALRSRGGRRCRRGQRVGAAAAAASLAVSSVGDALGRSGRPLARRALLSRRRPGGGRGRCSVLEAGHDACARELLAQGAHWLGEEVGPSVSSSFQFSAKCREAPPPGAARPLRAPGATCRAPSMPRPRPATAPRDPTYDPWSQLDSSQSFST